MSIYKLKKHFQNMLRPIVKLLAGIGVTANQVTLITCLFSIFMAGLIIKFNNNNKVLLILPFFLFVRMALNAIDGMLAREHNMQTPLGAILNELTDVVSDSAIYLSFCFVSGFNQIYIVLIALLAVISEMSGIVAVQIGASRRYDGPMGKSDRAFVFGVLALLIGLNVDIFFVLDYILITVNLLLVLTIINRSCKALKE